MGCAYGEFKRFFDGWEHVISEIPDAKRQALDEMGRAVLAEVKRQIIQRGVHDDRNHVRNWQRYRVGSGGGYVAVYPAKEKVQGKKASSRKITKYLEKGHAIRPPSGKAKRYKARINVDKVVLGKRNVIVPARQFYSFTRPRAEELAMRAAEKVLVKLENLFDL